MKEEQLQIIEMLAEVEMTTAKIYECFAKSFSEQENFWKHLATDEVEHASWLRGLYPKVEEGTLAFSKGRFDTKTIKVFQGYLNSYSRQAQAGELSLKQALNIAGEIEDDWIERGYFLVYDTDAPALAEVLKDLAKGTRHHREAIRQLVAEVNVDSEGA